MDKRKLSVIFLTCTIVAGSIIPLLSSHDNSTTLGILSEDNLEYSPETDLPINQESLTQQIPIHLKTALPAPIPTPTVNPTSTPTPLKIVTAESPSANYSSNEVYAIPSPTPIPADNSRELKASIDALGKTGGEIVLQSDLFLSGIDVTVPSNIVLSGVDPSAPCI